MSKREEEKAVEATKEKVAEQAKNIADKQQASCSFTRNQATRKSKTIPRVCKYIIR